MKKFKTWLDDLGRSRVTGWRWEKRGWIEVVRIAGQKYVSDAAIEEFNRRAAAGEFAPIVSARDNSRAVTDSNPPAKEEHVDL